MSSIALGFVLAPIAATAQRPDVGSVRVEASHAAMGTEFRIVAFGDDPRLVRAAISRAFLRVDRLEQRLSDYRADSELRQLEIDAVRRSVRVSPDLWNVLLEAGLLARATDGAFDPTVGAVTRLWRWAARRGVEPDTDQLDRATRSINHESMVLDPQRRTVSLARPGIRFDLGAIAKGYAVDAAFESMLDAGFTAVLVDGGGDVRVGAPPPDASGWRISVPATQEGEHEVLVVADVAIATSGADHRSILFGGELRSHVIDPRTGVGVPSIRTTTVLAGTAMRADALASALGVLGRDGLNAVLELGALDARVLEHSRASTTTGGSDGP